jgi:hypothetical protein
VDKLCEFFDVPVGELFEHQSAKSLARKR